MSAKGARPLRPTFEGLVQNSVDGLILFEACLSGELHRIARRLYARERETLVKSGNVFIYDENTSGVKRWTDDVAWSPSRISGNFLIYRELEKPFSPGEKRRATKRKTPNRLSGVLPSRDLHDCLHGSGAAKLIVLPEPAIYPVIETDLQTKDRTKDLEYSLIGSLVDSYGFLIGGLIKKTMRIFVNGVSHHMISYYRENDIKYNGLVRPTQDPRLQHITIRYELCSKQNFRVPVEETGHHPAIPGQMHGQLQMTCSSTDTGEQAVGYERYSEGHFIPTYALTPTTGVHRTSFGRDMLDTQWTHPSVSMSAAHLDHATWYWRSDYGASTQLLSNPEFESTTQAVPYSNPHIASCSSMQGESSCSSAGTMLKSCCVTLIQSGSPLSGLSSAYTDTFH
jgi:hypothetical protein